MDIYFVRHGQTGGNAARRHQAEHTPLTELGKQQAAKAGEKLKHVNPTHFIASTHVRTLETARIIGESLEMTPETSQLFIEVYRPDRMYGFHHLSPQSLWYVLWWFLGFAGGDSTSDPKGESYEALRGRLAQARLHLSSYPTEARVVVVSHSIFITFFIAHMCHEERLSFFSAIRLWFVVRKMKNGKIVHVRYTPNKNRCAWRIAQAGD